MNDYTMGYFAFSTIAYIMFLSYCEILVEDGYELKTTAKVVLFLLSPIIHTGRAIKLLVLDLILKLFIRINLRNYLFKVKRTI